MVGEGQRSEHHGEVGVDGFALVTWPAGRVWTFEGVLDAPQLVVGADHPGRFGVEDIGDVGLPAGQRAGLRFEIAVDRTSAAGEGDEPVPFDRRLPGDATD
jgi:hypothetical protein